MPVIMGDALREAMEERGFNQAELATYVDVEPMYISRWLRGTQPRFEEGVRILEMLGWRMDRLKSRAGILSMKGSKAAAAAESAKGYGSGDKLPALKTGTIADNGEIRFALRKTQVDSRIWMMSRGLLVSGEEVAILRNDSDSLAPKYARGSWIITQALGPKAELKPHGEYLLPDGQSGSTLRLFRIIPVTKGAKEGKPLAFDVARQTSRELPAESGREGGYMVVASASVN